MVRMIAADGHVVSCHCSHSPLSQWCCSSVSLRRSLHLLVTVGWLAFSFAHMHMLVDRGTHLLADAWQELDKLWVADTFQHCILCQLQSCPGSMLGGRIHTCGQVQMNEHMLTL